MRIAGPAAILTLTAIGAAAGWWTGVRAGQGHLAARGPAEQAAVRHTLETRRLEARELGGPLTLSERIVAIERRPGHCETRVPGAFADPQAYDYQLRLQTYTLFAIPTATIRFTCGGLAYEVE